MKINPAVERPLSLDEMVKAVLETPMSAPIDTELFKQAAVTNELFQRISPDTFEAIVTYIMRPEFSEALELYVVLASVKANHDLLALPIFNKWAKESKASRNIRL